MEMAGIEPATATLAGRARYLSCHPHRQASASFALACRFHGAHAMDVSIIQPVREAFRDGQFVSKKMKTAPRDFSLGRLPASACSRLPGNHSAGQGSRKPRRRIHVPGSLRCLAYRHVSMVSRHRETGQLYFLRILRASGRPWRGWWGWIEASERQVAEGPGTGRWRVARAAAGRGGGGVRGHGDARGRAETEFGINGGSSGKDGVITLGDHALVFSKLRRVTCGVAVHKAVDNRRDVRITRGILWRTCGQEKNLK